jgi:hypothetical protein
LYSTVVELVVVDPALKQCVDSMGLLRRVFEDVGCGLTEWDLRGVQCASRRSFLALSSVLTREKVGREQWADAELTLHVLRLWDFVDGDVAVLPRLCCRISTFSHAPAGRMSARQVLLGWLGLLAEKAELLLPIVKDRGLACLSDLPSSLNALCRAAFRAPAPAQPQPHAQPQAHAQVGRKRARGDADDAESVLDAFRDAWRVLSACGRGESWLGEALAVARSVSMERLGRFLTEVPGGNRAHRVLAACASAGTEDAALQIARAFKARFGASLSSLSGAQSMYAMPMYERGWTDVLDALWRTPMSADMPRVINAAEYTSDKRLQEIKYALSTGNNWGERDAVRDYAAFKWLTHKLDLSPLYASPPLHGLTDQLRAASSAGNAGAMRALLEAANGSPTAASVRGAVKDVLTYNVYTTPDMTDVVATTLPKLTHLHNAWDAASVIDWCCAESVPVETLSHVVAYVLQQPWAPDWTTRRTSWFAVVGRAAEGKDMRLIELMMAVRP